jgi:hypothetical protein
MAWRQARALLVAVVLCGLMARGAAAQGMPSPNIGGAFDRYVDEYLSAADPQPLRPVPRS